jgi:hypothetical protein
VDDLLKRLADCRSNVDLSEIFEETSEKLACCVDIGNVAE